MIGSGFFPMVSVAGDVCKQMDSWADCRQRHQYQSWQAGRRAGGEEMQCDVEADTEEIWLQELPALQRWPAALKHCIHSLRSIHFGAIFSPTNKYSRCLFGTYLENHLSSTASLLLVFGLLHTGVGGGGGGSLTATVRDK